MGLLANIKTALGQFVELHREELVEQMMQGYDTLTETRTILSEAQSGQTVGIPSSQLGEVVQGFQAKSTPKGTLEFTANKVIQRRHKVHLDIDPDVLVGEWEGYMYDEKMNRKDMPIVKYALKKLLLKIDEDRELQMVYNGVYSAPVVNVANAANQTVNGLGKILADYITAGAIVPFPLGPYTANTTFEYIESMFTSVPGLHRYKALNLYCSQDVLLDYQRDKRNSNPNYIAQMSDLLKVDFSNIKLKALPSMVGKKRIIATVPNNLVRILHKNRGADNLEVEKYSPYTVSMIADWHESFGIADTRYMWINDQV
jgi:hypothetical protein